jgi:hypothetical protein
MTGIGCDRDDACCQGKSGGEEGAGEEGCASVEDDGGEEGACA